MLTDKKGNILNPAAHIMTFLSGQIARDVALVEADLREWDQR